MTSLNEAGKSYREELLLRLRKQNKRRREPFVSGQEVMREAEVNAKQLKAEKESKRRKRMNDLYEHLRLHLQMTDKATHLDILDKAVDTLYKRAIMLEGWTVGMPFSDIIVPRYDFPLDLFDNVILLRHLM